MKVVIFEKEHYEGAFPVIKLFDLPGNEVIVYTTATTYKRFEDLFQERMKRFQWRLLPGNSKTAFFLALRRQLKKDKPDLLYANTISDNHLLYAVAFSLARPRKIVMTIHDINCLFESRPGGNLKAPFIHWGKKKLISVVDEFNVVSDTMIAYLQTKTSKKTHAIPGAVFERNQTPQQLSSPVRVVVPGSIDIKRRDYQEVFKLIELADTAGLKLQVTLLGGFTDEAGKAIVSRAQSLQSSSCSLITYNTRIVDQPEFDKQMDAAHFVFIPSVINTRICGAIPEIYGLTKSSGNIFDVIKHAKPFIIPKALTIPKYLDSSVFRYEEPGEIITWIQQLLDEPGSYSTWQQNAFDNSLEYTIERVRERHTGLFFNS